MKTWSEFENLDGETVYVDLTKIEAVLPHGGNQSIIVLNSGVNIYTRLRPAEVIRMMNGMLGA